MTNTGAYSSSMARYIFITGGVVSSLGKGIAAASLGAILEARGLKVTMMKLDPYINVDPGTMSPYQHGEVFVTDDGAETDLDLGHYERFIDESLTQAANVTYLNMQVRKGDRDVRTMVVGIAPGSLGVTPGWPPYLVAGRQITRAHYEALADIADAELGRALNTARSV